MRILSQDSRLPGRNLNPEFPEFEAGVRLSVRKGRRKERKKEQEGKENIKIETNKTLRREIMIWHAFIACVKKLCFHSRK
jgi:hypothetical protein